MASERTLAHRLPPASFLMRMFALLICAQGCAGWRVQRQEGGDARNSSTEGVAQSHHSSACKDYTAGCGIRMGWGGGAGQCSIGGGQQHIHSTHVSVPHVVLVQELGDPEELVHDGLDLVAQQLACGGVELIRGDGWT